MKGGQNDKKNLDNNHQLDKEQAADLKVFNEQLAGFYIYIAKLLEKGKIKDMDELNRKRDEILEVINGVVLSRIKILKKTQKGVKVSITYMDMLNETRSLIFNTVHLVKANARMLEYVEVRTDLTTSMNMPV